MSQAVEMKHSRNHAEPKYIAGERWNFGWLDEELATVIMLWRQGVHYRDIAKTMKRRDIETLIILADLQEVGGIEERRGGIFGYFGRRKKSDRTGV